MSASLVGSEMCIRDRILMEQPETAHNRRTLPEAVQGGRIPPKNAEYGSCLLYTSDAADDM
eukprot:2919748-Alexandrium_andersonii.AAC.1